MLPPIIPPQEFLDVRVTRGFEPTNHASLNLNQLSVFSQAVVLIIKAIDAWIPPLGVLIFLIMSFSTRKCFFLMRSNMPPPPLLSLIPWLFLEPFNNGFQQILYPHPQPSPGTLLTLPRPCTIQVEPCRPQPIPHTTQANSNTSFTWSKPGVVQTTSSIPQAKSTQTQAKPSPRPSLPNPRPSLGGGL